MGTTKPLQQAAVMDLFNISAKTLDELLKDYQRSLAIISLCRLDDAIERLLRASMIDDGTANELLGGPLQSIKHKIDLAYALGLIPEIVKKDLTLINKIRNTFAHHEEATSFAVSRIRVHCRDLSTAGTRGDDYLDSEEIAYRTAIMVNWMFLSNETSELKQQPTRADGQRQRRDALEARYNRVRTWCMSEPKPRKD